MPAEQGGDDTQRARDRARRRRRGRYPIVLPNRQLQRMLDRDARLMILTRKLSLGPRPHVDPDEMPAGAAPPRGGPRAPRLYELHNALTTRRNDRHRRNRRPDLQTDPHVVTIEVLAVELTTLGEVDLKQARAAGYKTVEEMREDWRQRRCRLDLNLPVYLHEFRVSDARYLHRDVHRGYTHDPDQAVQGEPPALTPTETERYARRARERDELVRAARRAEMPLEDRIRGLAARAAGGDDQAKRALWRIRQTVERGERKIYDEAA